MTDLLTYQEVEELLEAILGNAYLREVTHRLGSEFVLFRFPNNRETLFSRYLRRKALGEAKEAGLPSTQEVEQSIKDCHIISAADSARIDDLEEKVAAQRRLLQITRIEGRRKPIVENIERLEKEISSIKSKGSDLLYLSAETKADEEAFLYLVYASVHDLNFSKYWADFREFEDERRLSFRNAVIEAFGKFNRGLSTATIRFLARHNLWRIRYNAAAKFGGPLFAQEMVDWTPDQLALVYWSAYYQHIYELLPDDKPEDDVITDDEALDSYMEALYKRKDEERNEGKVKRRGGSSKKGKLSAWDRGEELIITAAHPQYLNMEYSQERIKAEGNADLEVVGPNSRRARNRAGLRRNRRGL